MAALVAGFALFAFIESYLLYRLFRPQPLVMIGEAGIVDHASLGAVGRLSWGEIASVERQSVAGTAYITLHAYSPAKVISRQRSPIKRWRLKLRVSKGWGTAAIPEALLPDPDEAFAAVQAAWRSWRERTGTVPT